MQQLDSLQLTHCPQDEAVRIQRHFGITSHRLNPTLAKSLQLAMAPETDRTSPSCIRTASKIARQYARQQNTRQETNAPSQQSLAQYFRQGKRGRGMSGHLMPGRYELKARTLAAMDCQNKYFTGASIFLLYAFFSVKLNQSHVEYLSCQLISCLDVNS